MKRLLVYLKDYKKESILAPLFKMLEASFELFVPLVVADMIDTGISHKDGGYILRMGALLLLLAIIGLVCSITAQYFAAKAATGFAAKMKHALFLHIQKLGYTEMDTQGTATLITRMTSDSNQVQNGVNLVLRLFLRSPFIVLGAMVMAFTIDVQAALIFVVTIPLLSIVVFGIMIASIPLYKKVQGRLDAVLGITRENLTGVRVIRAFHQEEEETKRFEESNQTLTKVQMFVGRISALMNPLTFVIVNGAIMALIWTGAWKVDSGVLTQGQVVALVNYMSQILVELVKLASLIINITKALACAKRIEGVFEMHASLTESEKAVDGWQKKEENIVDFNHVTLQYKNAGAPSLTDIDFHVKRGETIGVIGGTGSGKSSLVNLIPRFYDVTEGSVCVNGTDVKYFSLNELRKRIGVVPQKAVLFAGSIRDNLLWGKEDATDAEIKKALQISQADEFVAGKEEGLDTFITQGGKNLSGGQRQRLTIARAVIRKPDILILDDSASALDFATDAKLRKAIREMENRPAVFIVSQRAASIQYADQIIVLDDGMIAGIGKHEELLKTCSVYQEIYYSQFRKSKQSETEIMHGEDVG